MPLCPAQRFLKLDTKRLTTKENLITWTSIEIRNHSPKAPRTQKNKQQSGRRDSAIHTTVNVLIQNM
jgi:hypothetical protein